jgi:hypothetical protein
MFIRRRDEGKEESNFSPVFAPLLSFLAPWREALFFPLPFVIFVGLV